MQLVFMLSQKMRKFDQVMKKAQIERRKNAAVLMED